MGNLEIWIATDYANLLMNVGVVYGDMVHMLRYHIDPNGEILGFQESAGCSKRDFFDTCDHDEYFVFEKIFG